MSRIRVAVLYGGTSAEHEVSVVSARSVLAAIDPQRYDVLPVAVTKQGRWLLPDRGPDRLEAAGGGLPAVSETEGTVVSLAPRARAGGGTEPVDVVFSVLHGPGGEDGTVQGMLDVLGIPYVGAGVAASAVGMDKSLMKPVFREAGIPVVDWVTVRASAFAADPQAEAARAIERVGLPCFTKPASLGSSVGVSKCRTAEEVIAGLDDALRHGDVALAERAIDGRELECAVLGNDDPQASVVGEIVPVHEFYDYESKYLLDGSDLIIPAPVDEAIAQRIRRLSVEAFRAVGCSGMARVDFFVAGDDVYCNEINTLPGFTPISMYPKLWEASGIPYPKLIDRLIELALERAG